MLGIRVLAENPVDCSSVSRVDNEDSRGFQPKDKSAAFASS